MSFVCTCRPGEYPCPTPDDCDINAVRSSSPERSEATGGICPSCSELEKRLEEAEQHLRAARLALAAVREVREARSA